MPRIRSIHPGQWTDEEFVSLSMESRILCIALRNEADDQGVFEWKPITLKMRIFPCDNVDVSSLLEELVGTNQIIKFEEAGKCFGAIRNFCKFQRPKKPSFVYHLPQQLRNYVGLRRPQLPKSYQNPPDIGKEEGENCETLNGDKFGTGGEKSPQRKEEGGNRNTLPSEEAEKPPDRDDLDKVLYQRGKALLGKSAGGQITKIKNALGVGKALEIIEQAGRKENPAEWIAGVIRNDSNTNSTRPANGGHRTQGERKAAFLAGMSRALDP